MPELIENPSRVEAAGTKPKLIDEYVGRVNSGESRVSIARMRSPDGWLEPGQRQVALVEALGVGRVVAQEIVGNAHRLQNT